ncbi:MAG: hypothetical protein OEW05_00730 [Candidatus Aminicenantes bacterium]|nr:hypothetical protein [Candidatus Aminicenantes bacterium]
MAIVSSLVKTTRRLSWQGIQERFPLETQLRQAVRFLALLYPDVPQTDELHKSLEAAWSE